MATRKYPNEIVRDEHDEDLFAKKVVGAEPTVSERVSDTSGNSTAFTSFDAQANKYYIIQAYSIHNSSGTDGYVDFRDGTGGAVLWTVPIPSTGGANLSLPGGFFRTTTGNALAFDVSGALSTVYISVSGLRKTA
jgi:hypothetical protein